jgi:hypothetical protein
MSGASPRSDLGSGGHEVGTLVFCSFWTCAACRGGSWVLERRRLVTPGECPWAHLRRRRGDKAWGAIHAADACYRVTRKLRNTDAPLACIGSVLISLAAENPLWARPSQSTDRADRPAPTVNAIWEQRDTRLIATRRGAVARPCRPGTAAPASDLRSTSSLTWPKGAVPWHGECARQMTPSRPRCPACWTGCSRPGFDPVFAIMEKHHGAGEIRRSIREALSHDGVAGHLP